MNRSGDKFSAISAPDMRALSVGIGLGELRKLDSDVIKVARTDSPHFGGFMPVLAQQSLATPAMQPATIANVIPKHRSSITMLSLYFFIHSIDMVIVTFTVIASTLLAACIFVSWDKINNVQSLFESFPLKDILQLPLIVALVVLYAVYVLYLVFFRIFLGATLAQSWFGFRKYPAKANFLRKKS